MVKETFKDLPKEPEFRTPASHPLQTAWDAVVEARAKANSSQNTKAGKATLARENDFKMLKAKAEAEGKKVQINEHNQIELL